MSAKNGKKSINEGKYVLLVYIKISHKNIHVT